MAMHLKFDLFVYKMSCMRCWYLLAVSFSYFSSVYRAFHLPLVYTLEHKNLCQESLKKVYDTRVMKKFKKFLYWTEKNFG